VRRLLRLQRLHCTNTQRLGNSSYIGQKFAQPFLVELGSPTKLASCERVEMFQSFRPASGFGILHAQEYTGDSDKDLLLFQFSETKNSCAN
jgi:hypothetical protein